MPHMIDDYQQRRVEFRKILSGILSERNRWSQCVEWTNKKLGMAVGALFIRDNFNHESKVNDWASGFRRTVARFVMLRCLVLIRRPPWR